MVEIDLNLFKELLTHLDGFHTCSLSRPLLLLALQVWVRQTVVENDLNLFKELPTHLRAHVAWRSNKSIMDKLDTFQVCC